MNVGELKRLLSFYLDDLKVVIACDSEGNKFSPLADISPGRYVPENTWAGEVFPIIGDFGDRKYEAALVMHPVN